MTRQIQPAYVDLRSLNRYLADTRNRLRTLEAQIDRLSKNVTARRGNSQLYRFDVDINPGDQWTGNPVALINGKSAANREFRDVQSGTIPLYDVDEIQPWEDAKDIVQTIRVGLERWYQQPTEMFYTDDTGIPAASLDVTDPQNPEWTIGFATLNPMRYKPTTNKSVVVVADPGVRGPQEVYNIFTEPVEQKSAVLAAKVLGKWFAIRGGGGGGSLFWTNNGVIPGATGNAPSISLGAAQCRKLDFTSGIVSDTGEDFTVYNSVEDSVKDDEVIQCKLIQGEWFVDVENCPPQEPGQQTQP